MRTPRSAALAVLVVVSGATALIHGRGPDAAQDPRGIRAAAPRVLVEKGRDFALLFATDEYRDPAWSRLRNPIRDATTIATELREHYGFEEAQVVENPTLQGIMTTLQEYLERRLADNDQLLIFFAGHGLYRPDLDLGFIVASDSRAAADDRTNQSFLPFNTLYRYVDQLKAKHIFLVLDVCHGGTFGDVSRSRGGDPARDYDSASPPERISRILQRTTRKFLTSGGNEYVPDGSGAHSPFAAKFLEALRSRRPDGILTATDVYQTVRNVRPNEPVYGDFGKYEPVSDFLFVNAPTGPRSFAEMPYSVGHYPRPARVGTFDYLLGGRKLPDGFDPLDTLLSAGVSFAFTATDISNRLDLLWFEPGMDLTPMLLKELNGERQLTTAPDLGVFRAGLVDMRYLLAGRETWEFLQPPADLVPISEDTAVAMLANRIRPEIAGIAAAFGLDMVFVHHSVFWATDAWDLTPFIKDKLSDAKARMFMGAFEPAQFPSASAGFAFVRYHDIVEQSVRGRQVLAELQKLGASMPVQSIEMLLTHDSSSPRVTELLQRLKAEIVATIATVAKSSRRRLVANYNSERVIWANPNADITAAVVKAMNQAASR